MVILIFKIIRENFERKKHIKLRFVIKKTLNSTEINGETGSMNEMVT